jgi:hypothetical protein
LVIARGAAGIRVLAAGDDGVILLEADGSPGAVLPVPHRIEAQIRAAVPAVTGVRLAEVTIRQGIEPLLRARLPGYPA